jgi:hypothetical protein
MAGLGGVRLATLNARPGTSITRVDLYIGRRKMHMHAARIPWPSDPFVLFLGRRQRLGACTSGTPQAEVAAHWRMHAYDAAAPSMQLIRPIDMIAAAGTYDGRLRHAWDEMSTS